MKIMNREEIRQCDKDHEYRVHSHCECTGQEWVRDPEIGALCDTALALWDVLEAADAHQSHRYEYGPDGGPIEYDLYCENMYKLRTAIDNVRANE